MDLDAVRRELEARRAAAGEKVAELAKAPELGEAQGFGKRIGDGTTEAISRITEIGVGRSLEATLARTERARQLHEGDPEAEHAIQLEHRQAPNGTKEPAAR